MNKSDQWVNVMLAILILIHFSILIIGLIIHKLPVLIPLLNIAVAFSIIVYWIQKQLRIEQHFIDVKEMIVLGMEAVVIATAVYFTNTAQRDQSLKVMQYIIFGVHLTCLVLFIVFMLTFKMKRLL
jgi:hypothetical protein